MVSEVKSRICNLGIVVTVCRWISSWVRTARNVITPPPICFFSLVKVAVVISTEIHPSRIRIIFQGSCKSVHQCIDICIMYICTYSTNILQKVTFTEKIFESPDFSVLSLPGCSKNSLTACLVSQRTNSGQVGRGKGRQWPALVQTYLRNLEM